MKEPILLLIVIVLVLIGEALIFPTIPDPRWVLEEDLKIYKEICNELYPIALITNEPITNKTIFISYDKKLSERLKLKYGRLD